MCITCNEAMNSVVDRGDGATALAWERADAAIKAWRKTLPDDVEFEGIIEECEAWCAHIGSSVSQQTATT